jgi:DNA-binding transcriptional MerR regulator
MMEREWRIGELARATHVTVRTLRHYDQLGLLVPSSRTAGGHRCYTDGDVRRLHKILALRGFGLSLQEIGQVLEQGGDDPRSIVRRQLVATEERIRQAMRLRTRLLTVLGGLEQLTEPSAEQLVSLIEEMVRFEQPLTAAQWRELAAARAEKVARLSDAELTELSRKRATLMAALSAEDLAELGRGRAGMTSGSSSDGAGVEAPP